ncbi:hypothetical protein RND71_044053 [Anisodus tanguticus]|uniref:Uncharacterized protein n=1 Tax=Anisodus tanguticus TaxID=243964 RepID=A0AAE1QR93_9SOLA|nr:hypothetical protein RND71_044053 [Anisodus tanguticus]
MTEVPLANINDEWAEFGDFKSVNINEKIQNSNNLDKDKFFNFLNSIDLKIEDDEVEEELIAFQDENNLNEKSSGSIKVESLEELVNTFDEKIVNCFINYEDPVDNFVPVQVLNHEELLNECQFSSYLRQFENEDEEQLAKDLDFHCLILCSNGSESFEENCSKKEGNNSQLLFTAEEVLKELDIILKEDEEEKNEELINWSLKIVYPFCKSINRGYKSTEAISIPRPIVIIQELILCNCKQDLLMNQ